MKKDTLNPIFVVAFIIILLTLFSCKKSKTSPAVIEQPTLIPIEELSDIPPEGTLEERIADSIFLYAKQVYYWNDLLPGYGAFNPRRNTGNIGEIIKKIQNYAPKSLRTGKSIDTYSFYDSGQAKTSVGGINPGDYGLALFYHSRFDLRVKMVYGDSPAAKAGISRGFKVIAINGNTEIQLTATSQVPPHVIESLFGSSNTLALKLEDYDGKIIETTLTKAAFNIQPLLFYEVYTTRTGKKIGYFVYNSFTLNSTLTLASVISSFQRQGCEDLIIDLRYNGGGSVITAEVLCNLLINPSRSRSPMIYRIFNDTMQNGKAFILRNQIIYGNNGRPIYGTGYDNGKYATYFDFPYARENNRTNFAKMGSYSPKNIVFITTRATASASETVINALRPHMNLKLVGSTTYGKPVGFYALKIGTNDVYFPLYETQNSDFKGGFFEGMRPDIEKDDDVTKNWGDKDEALFATAFNYLSTGILPGGVARKAAQKNKLSDDILKEHVDLLCPKTEIRGMYLYLDHLDKPLVKRPSPFN